MTDAINDGLQETSFAQQNSLKKVKCFKCGKRGHTARDCNEEIESNSDDSSATKRSSNSIVRRDLLCVDKL